jgi:SAM-dependent methyltransferase
MKLTLAGYAKAIYFKLIDVFHLPFVKNGAVDPYHVLYNEFISIGKAMPSPAVLEIGSRNVTGITRRDLFPHCREYVGFDIRPGESVDIVGDVHKLSDYCASGHFDLVYIISVFEHVLFPWKAVLEINKVMKTGGYLHVSTHTVWPEHEMPWDFWRFQQNGFHALFNKYTGFEIISLTEGLPCKAYSLVDDAPTRNLWFYTMNQGIAVIAKKISEYQSDLLKWDIDIADVINTMYPDLKSK